MTFFHPLQSMLFFIVTFLFLSFLHNLYLGTHCDDRYMQAFVLYPLDTTVLPPTQKKNKQMKIRVKTCTTYSLCGVNLGIFCGDQSWHAERFLHVPFKIIVVTLAQA